MRTAAHLLRNQASLALAFLLCGAQAGYAGAAPVPLGQALPEGWRVEALPVPSSAAPDGQILALARAERTAPLRYRVIVVPGSGCAGMGPVADRYFAGLLHGQVLVLHKSGVHPMDSTPAHACPLSFVRRDALGAWQTAARAALQGYEAAHPPTVPTVLVGISEGAELLPGMAAVVQGLQAVVLIASSGLDPREAGALQAQRLGYGADWDALGALQVNPSAADDLVVQGRSLRYWRDLWQWPLQQPLVHGPWPLLQAWGESDELVPPVAYERFAQRMSGAIRAGERTAPWCTLRLPGADHGLQSAQGATPDGVQRVWAAVEQWGRAPQQGLCGAVR